MKCNHCGTNFETKFCPECGAKADFGTVQSSQQVPQGETNPKKNKKPFYRRRWFIIIVILVVFIALTNSEDTEKIVWKDMVLGQMLPEPANNKGKIWNNSSEELHIDINKIKDVQYENYVEDCKEKGFTVDGVKDSYSYEAYNAEGYKLYVNYSSYNTEMGIELDIPMEMTEIKWPSGSAGKQLPQPESNKGNFEYEHDDSFYVFISDTSKKAYSEYVSACADEGFNVDYDKSENYYHAENAEGWSIRLEYEGFNIMSIDIDAPDDYDESDTTTEEKEEPTETSEPKETTTETSNTENDITTNELIEDYEEIGSDLEIVLKANHPKYLDDVKIANEVWENEIEEKKVFVTDSIYSNSADDCIIEIRTSEETDDNDSEVEYISSVDIYFERFDEEISFEKALNIIATYLPEDKIQQYYVEEMSFSELTDFENQTRYSKSYELKDDSYRDIVQLDSSFGVMVWVDENGYATEARIDYVVLSPFDDETMDKWNYDYFSTSNKEPSIETTKKVTTTETTTTEVTTTETTTKKSGRTVYITPTGEKYHCSASCAGKNAMERDYDDIEGVYDPCKKCAY